MGNKQERQECAVKGQARPKDTDGRQRTGQRRPFAKIVKRKAFELVSLPDCGERRGRDRTSNEKSVDGGWRTKKSRCSETGAKTQVKQTTECISRIQRTETGRKRAGVLARGRQNVM